MVRWERPITRVSRSHSAINGWSPNGLAVEGGSGSARLMTANSDDVFAGARSITRGGRPAARCGPADHSSTGNDSSAGTTVFGEHNGLGFFPASFEPIDSLLGARYPGPRKHENPVSETGFRLQPTHWRPLQKEAWAGGPGGSRTPKLWRRFTSRGVNGDNPTEVAEALVWREIERPLQDDFFAKARRQLVRGPRRR